MRTIPLFVYAAAIAWFSLTPADQYPVDVWDKLMHFTAYGIFVIIAVPVADTSGRLVKLGCGIIAYGVLMEILQSLVPGRSMSALDAIANSLGALTALLSILWLRRRMQS